MTGLLDRLRAGVVLGAEGYLFELERRGYLKSGPYVPEVVLDRPEAVAELHREFLRAGAEVMVAFTYYGHEEKLRAVGRAGDVEALNRQALRLARAAADFILSETNDGVGEPRRRPWRDPSARPARRGDLRPTSPCTQLSAWRRRRGDATRDGSWRDG